MLIVATGMKNETIAQIYVAVKHIIPYTDKSIFKLKYKFRLSSTGIS